MAASTFTLLLLLCYCPGPKRHGQLLSRLCRSADVPGTRLQIRRVRTRSGGGHSIPQESVDPKNNSSR